MVPRLCKIQVFERFIGNIIYLARKLIIYATKGTTTNSFSFKETKR